MTEANETKPESTATGVNQKPSATTTTKKKIPRDLAAIEIDKWLDFKRLTESKRETSQDNIDLMIECIETGTLILREDFVLEHKLVFPIKNSDGQVTVEMVEYKPRLMLRDINNKMKGVKVTDSDARLLGYLSALTGKPPGVLGAMDTVDNSIAQSIVSFFL